MGSLPPPACGFCCEAAPCEADVETIAFQRSAAASKCGFTGFQSAKIYKILQDTWARTVNFSNDSECDPAGPTGPFTTNSSRNLTSTLTRTQTFAVTGASVSFVNEVGGSCSNHLRFSNGGSSLCGTSSDTNCTQSYSTPSGSSGSSDTGCPGASSGIQVTSGGTGSCADCGNSGFGTPVASSDTSAVFSNSFPTTDLSGNVTGSWTESYTKTLSEEFTDSEVQSLLEARLSAVPEVAGSTASASYLVSGVSRMGTVCRYKRRFSRPAFKGCKATIKWDEIFTPVSGAPTLLATRTVHWDLGTHCRPGAHADDTLDSDEYTIDLPSTPGTVTLSDVRITCP